MYFPFQVYVFFGDSSALLDFVMLLAFRGMLDLEYEYFVLAADVAVDLGSSKFLKKTNAAIVFPCVCFAI